MIILELPGLPPKGDLTDWLDQGRTQDELRSLALAKLLELPTKTNEPPRLATAEPTTQLPLPLKAKTKPSRGGKAKHHERKSVLDALGHGGFLQVARELGLRLVGSGPNAKGWWECKAIDREDINPSAAFNVNTCRYVDHGPSGTKLSIFDLAMQLAPAEYATIGKTIDSLGDRFIGERSRVESKAQPAPVKPTVVGLANTTDEVVAELVDENLADQLVDEDVGGDPTEADAGPPAIDVLDIRQRVREVVEAKNLEVLYSDPHLLLDLARLERADPAAFAGIENFVVGPQEFPGKGFLGGYGAASPVRRGAGRREGQGFRRRPSGRARHRRDRAVPRFRRQALRLDPEGRPSGNPGYPRRTIQTELEEEILFDDRLYAGADTFRSALDVLEMMASDGPLHDVHVRTAEVADPVHEFATTLYLDLGNLDRQVVRITREGWELVTDPPVRFRRPGGMMALPVPLRGGSLEQLRPFLNIRETDFLLILAWITAATRTTGPFPILVFSGEQGAPKSSTSKVSRLLVNPHMTLLRGSAKDEQDLMIGATNSHVLAFDNLSVLPDWFSDGLCRIASGSGFSTRQLYTNEEEVHLAASRPILFNGIEEIAGRGDLLQRSLLVNLPAIADDGRRTERTFWKEFAAAHPQILGGPA